MSCVMWRLIYIYKKAATFAPFECQSAPAALLLLLLLMTEIKLFLSKPRWACEDHGWFTTLHYKSPGCDDSNGTERLPNEVRFFTTKAFVVPVLCSDKQIKRMDSLQLRVIWTHDPIIAPGQSDCWRV